MRVLVTGGAGFLGKSLTRCLLQRGDTVVAFDTSVVGLKDLQGAAGDRLFAVTGDITDASSIATAFKVHMPDVIVHCAAAAGAPTPILAIRTNVEGSVNVFDAMRLFGVRRCIHVSSEESYGAFRTAMIDEDHPQNPVTAYGISKLAVEHLSRTYRMLHGLDVVHLRTSWVYGVGLPRNRVPKNLIEAALSGQPLHIPQGGDSAIDHTYVDDFVSAALLALDYHQHPYDVYNIGSGTSPTLYEVVEIIKETVPNADISIGAGVYRYFGEFEICRKGALDVGRARRVLGYVPRFDFRAGVREYIEQVRRGRGGSGEQG